MVDKKTLAKAYLYWKDVEKKAVDEAEKRIAQENLKKIRKLSEKPLTKS
jgi:restriction endonuclease Mrr